MKSRSTRPTLSAWTSAVLAFALALVVPACRPTAEPPVPLPGAARSPRTPESEATRDDRDDHNRSASEGAAPAEPANPIVGSPPATIGFASIPTVSASSRKANRDGLALHRAGEFDKARAKFEVAVAKSPDHDMARYNLACALSRLGKTQGAAQHLRLLMERDPQRFLPRIATDGDLRAVRDSDFGPALMATADAARRGLTEALASGLPAMLYRSSPWVPGDDGTWRGGPLDHAVGVYLHATKRFVALAHGGDHGFLDPARQAVYLADGTHCDGEVDLTWRRLSISRVSVDAGATSASLDIDRQAPTLADDRGGMKRSGRCAFADRASVRGESGDTTWIELEWPRTEHGATERWFVLGADGARVAGVETPPMSITLDVVLEGAAIWTPLPDGHRLSADRYRPAGADTDIVLRRTHRRARWQSVVVSPDGAYAFVTSIQHELRDEEAILRHAIVRVSLTDRALTEWSEGSGTAAVSFGADGALYVEHDGRLRRWASPEHTPDRGEPLAPGVHIAPYLEAPWCQTCG